MKLKIDPDFKNFIPPLSTAEFKQLEENILSEKRCREAILIWKRFVIDGHNRYAICHMHNIPFEISKLNFDSKEDALIWIAENQLGRRNLSNATRIDIASRMSEMLRQKAKKNLALKEKVAEPVNVQKSIAAAAGVSEQMVHRYMKILGCADAKMVEKLRNGELRINTAYNQLKVATKVVKIIDVGASENEDGLEEFCKINGQVEKIERAYGILVLARNYGTYETEKRLEKQYQFLRKLPCCLFL